MSGNRYSALHSFTSSRDVDGGFRLYLFWVTSELNAEIQAQLDAGKPEDDIIADLQDDPRAWPSVEHSCDKDGLYQGDTKLWHSNRVLGEVIPNDQGLPNGLSREWDKNGQQVSKGLFKNNKNIGLWFIDPKILDEGVLPEGMTGPWFFFTDDQEDPVADGETPEEIIAQDVVKDYLRSKGIAIVTQGPFYLFCVDNEIYSTGRTVDGLLLERDVTRNIMMDHADVPYSDPLETGNYPEGWKEMWQEYWQKRDGAEPSQLPSPEPF